jgi:glycosyltransferase involved in cell wall biosynthesis
VVPVSDAWGGTYQYGLSLVDAVAAIRRGQPPVVIVEPESPIATVLRARGYTVVSRSPASWRRTARKALGLVVGDGTVAEVLRRLRAARDRTTPAEIQFNVRLERWIRSHEVDLVLYVTADAMALESRLPYIMAIHDLQHRLQPEFPEVSANGEWERREHLIRNSIHRALMVLVDSEIGREDVLSLYGDLVEPDRVKVLPFVPAPYLDHHIGDSEVERVRAVYALPASYLLFPAQFWSHKNHLRVVKAIGALRARGIEVPVVMCGSADGAHRSSVLHQVLDEASAARVSDLVHVVGYVPDSDMAALYRGARAVVLPTFFGPTNIPVVEAWAMNVPVITSDIRGIREQCGDAALLVDPGSVDAIVDGIAALWRDELLRSRLIRAGAAKLRGYGPREFRVRLHQILQEAERRLSGASNAPLPPSARE